MQWKIFWSRYSHQHFSLLFQILPWGLVIWIILDFCNLRFFKGPSQPLFSYNYSHRPGLQANTWVITAVGGTAYRVDPFTLPLLICPILGGFSPAMCTFYLSLPVGTLKPSPTSNGSQYSKSKNQDNWREFLAGQFGDFLSSIVLS